jgi:hypothetical protein
MVAAPAPRRGATATVRLLLLGLVTALVARWHAGTAMPSLRNRLLAPKLAKPDRSSFRVAKPYLPNVPKQPGTEGRGNSIWRCGDRVRAVAPLNKTNGGRGYYNEGAAIGENNVPMDVTPYQRDAEEDERELNALPKIIEAGTEGTVVSVFHFSQHSWPYERPQHWQGHARPWVLVDFDGADNPIEACEEWDLEMAGDDFRTPFANNRPLYDKYGNGIFGLTEQLKKAGATGISRSN